MLVNNIDFPPSTYSFTAYNKTVNGFDIFFSAFIESINYTLDWTITR